MATDARVILVVDDDPAIRKVLKQSLELEGFGVSEASDGEEALSMLHDVRPDLVILDVMMPRMDGFEVLKTIRDSEDHRDMPVVMLTARSTQEDVWDGWSGGVDYYMTKPFDIDELLRFVEYVFSGEGEGTASDVL